jgi:lipoprotein-anchoring transpeptidase ErfK/SrfK
MRPLYMMSCLPGATLYGVHGTPEPSRIGRVQSHGCVRPTTRDVPRVAQWARNGTRVVFR